jgi:CheY-like chemotaxis protein
MAHSKIIVLVVEDEPLVRMGIVDHLEDDGFTVLEASNSEEAIAILVKNLDIKIVFTDVDMPGGMDGLMLAAAIRNRWPPIKIVVTSGHRKVAVDDLPVEAQFIAKPYSFDKIVTTFRSLAN